MKLMFYYSKTQFDPETVDAMVWSIDRLLNSLFYKGILRKRFWAWKRFLSVRGVM